ncbi:hypothetical protein [Streptacidiphilus anmyonensis]|uniref:hypothetical protein n=1 Tax=Streptacidiphilus anmyonensis TaxID=405782 RepID=UPI00128D3268|nr:hypothetical protein [Streptacidiphilus anmyonensis]
MTIRRHTITPAASRSRRRGSRLRMLASAAALAALAGGCASATAVTAATTGAAASTSAPPPSPGTSVPPGTRMPNPGQAGTPSTTARMVCSPEIRNDVTRILAPPKAPTTTSTWTDHLYTCTYHLPTGHLVLTVKESPDAASANAYFASLRSHLGPTTPLTVAQALGNPGYESAGGTVVVLKDGMTLRVDATGMTAASGPHHLSRADLAYEIASDILGCWNG